MSAKLSKKFVLIFALLIFLSPVFIFADSQGQTKTFFVNQSYNAQQRAQVSAVLEKVSVRAYFYIEKSWYEGLTNKKKKTVEQILNVLAKEFDNKIYPNLTSTYGPEWTPGIDNDPHITILFHQLKEGTAGYFNSGDEYERVQTPDSNQREMIYLNADNIFYEIIKSYIAHEFTHLITFNQKERLRGVSEDTWLNEARADYSPTLLGYDDVYQGSNLQQRLKEFINSPSDPLIEWRNQKRDYGVANIFIQYLAGRYGVKVLADSLKSPLSGIASINQALKKNNIKKNFSQIFTDWAVSVFLNDCSLGDEYCYKTENLKNLKITPSLIFLPSTQKTNVSLNYSIKPWSGNWYRVIGGKGELSLYFRANASSDFNLPYILCKDSSHCQIDFLTLDNNREANLIFKDFGANWTSLTLIPLVEAPNLNSNSLEPSFNFSLSISLKDNSQEKLIQRLMAQIEELKAKIAAVQEKIAAILAQKSDIYCQRLSQNLYLGMKNAQVKCLQGFLKKQGKEIYPQGIISGFFGGLTREAVIRFQDKYKKEILLPLGLKNGTGYVGFSTRQKINELINIKPNIIDH